MALIERITRMKSQGMSDSQIVKALIEEKFNPVQINEAFSQLKIKNAVQQEPAKQFNITEENQNEEQMEQSIMLTPKSEANLQEAPIQQEYSQEQGFIEPPTQDMNYSQDYGQQTGYEQPQGNYEPQSYEQQTINEQQNPEQFQTNAGYEQNQMYAQPQEQYFQQQIDFETIKDISKQIIDEEIRKLKVQLADLSKIKNEIQSQIAGIESRLGKIEETMQNIQYSVLKKVEDYGLAISNLSKEIHATQESFSKMINPIMDLKRGKIPLLQSNQQMPQSKIQMQEQKNQAHPQQQESRQQRPKPSPSFEDYLR